MGLPSGEDVFNWPDTSGAAHQWPGPQFVALGTAVIRFTYACDQAAGGHTTTLPSNEVTID